MTFAIYRSCLAALALCLTWVSAAQAFETRAQAAFVLDQTTGTILLNKNGDEALPPASMSKLMTLYMAFEAVREGRLSMEDRLPVSRHAMSFGGSTMFLDTTDRVRVEDLIRGIVVLSGNDACVVIAEALSPTGTESGFARAMTRRAQQLGMTQSTFVNSSGWPADGHVMTMRDLVTLADRLIKDFPEFYPMFAERRFEFDGRASSNVSNRNPLLGLGIGADGLKTGHTQEAGFGLVGSARQNGRRVIFAITGLNTAAARAEEAEAIVNWSFRQFDQKTVLREGRPVIEAEVWMGEVDEVALVPEADLEILLPVLGDGSVEAEVIYTGPLEAPIDAGQELAEMIIRPEGLPEHRIPLVAARDVAKAGILRRAGTVARVLLLRMGADPDAL